MNKRLIDILAYRCNDAYFDDFSQSVYEESMLFAARAVARKYSLLNRYYSFKANAKNESDKKAPLKLKIHSFSAETMVRVNEIEYSRTHDLRLDGEKIYQLYYGTDCYLFNYSPRNTEDRIDLLYTADITVDDFDDESITPVIPQRYDEDLLKNALLYISELGIAKFREEKKAKYMSIYKLNSNKSTGTESGEKRTWPTLQVFKVI